MRLALEIINELEDRLGWPQSATLENPTPTDRQRKLLRLFNRVLRSFQALDDWPLLRTETDMVLVASEASDLTDMAEQYVNATQNSDIVTIDNMTALDATYVGRAFQVVGDNYVYRIIDVPDVDQLQLNRAWLSDSIATVDERTFIIAMDRYALPTDFDRPTGKLQSFFAPYGIHPISPEEFLARRRAAGGIKLSDPEVYTIYGMNEAQTVELIHFDPYPDDARMLFYSYQANHPTIDSDNDKILIRERYIEALIDMVLQLAYRDYEDDDKVQQTLADMLRAFNTQHGNPGITTQLPRITPSGAMRQSWQAAYGNLSGMRFDWGDTFDRAGNTGFRN